MRLNGKHMILRLKWLIGEIGERNFRLKYLSTMRLLLNWLGDDHSLKKSTKAQKEIQYNGQI
jgi:hypothetical protein